jgi:hypothetical protein
MNNPDVPKNQELIDQNQITYFSEHGVKVFPRGEINSPLVYTYELEEPLENLYPNATEVIMVAGIRNPTGGEFVKQVPPVLESGFAKKIHYVHFPYDKALDVNEITQTLSNLTSNLDKSYTLVGASIGADLIAEFITTKLAQGENIENIDKALFLSPVLSSLQSVPSMMKKAGRIIEFGTRFAERFSKINGDDQAHEIPPMAMANIGRLKEIAEKLRLNASDVPDFQRKGPSIEIHWIQDPKKSAIDTQHEYINMEAQMEIVSKLRQLTDRVIFSRDLTGLHGGLSHPQTSDQYTKVIINCLNEVLEPNFG